MDKNLINGLSSEYLDQALRSVYELLEWYPFLLLGDTAKGAIDGELFGNKITIGLEKKYFTPDVVSYLKTQETLGLLKRKNVVWEEDKITWEENGVPIELKLIERKYMFFKYPAAVSYNYDDFLIPNPFEKYYKARFIVK